MEYATSLIYFLSFVIVISYGRMEKERSFLDADLFIGNAGSKLNGIVNFLFVLMVITGIISLFLNWQLILFVAVFGFVVVRLAPFWTDDIVYKILRSISRQ